MRDCLDARHDDPRVWSDYLTMLHGLGETDAFDATMARVPSFAETEPDLWIFRGEASERARRLVHRRGTLSPGSGAQREPAHGPLPADDHRGSPGPLRNKPTRTASAGTSCTRRGSLHEALDAYLDAQERLTNDSPELLASMKRLASICQTLGWSRAAEAWSRLAVR